jgi:alcohol dehydrogenase class IV
VNHVRFILRAPGQVTFGAGCSLEAPALAARFGRRVLLVVGGASLERSGTLERMQIELARAGATSTLLRVTGEPEVRGVDDGAAACRDAGCDAVLAIGGGSVIDSAKAIAALATNAGHASEYLEDLAPEGPRPVARDPLPVVAVPTTAGSGSEVTRNAVLRVATAAVKRSMRSDRMIPRVAVVDPDLTSTAPLAVAASAGLDALTHLIEAYVSRGAQPTTDLMALEGIGRAGDALRALAAGKSTPESQAAMALASLWGGLALANAGLGAVHGLVAPLGGRCAVPHGAGCGCLLAATLRANTGALRSRAPESAALVRYAAVAGALTGDRQATVEGAADAIDALRAALDVGPLARYGVTEEDLAPVIARARGGSMRTNPIELTDAELESILTSALRGSKT